MEILRDAKRVIGKKRKDSREHEILWVILGVPESRLASSAGRKVQISAEILVVIAEEAFERASLRHKPVLLPLGVRVRHVNRDRPIARVIHQSGKVGIVERYSLMRFRAIVFACGKLRQLSKLHHIHAANDASRTVICRDFRFAKSCLKGC